MSTITSAPPFEFDFWEFVTCTKCQLPFTSESGATIPFWLTECGHIVCNSHLNADQSCPQCRSPGVQLVPLQREMEPPMSDWFRSIPYALDTVAYAAKFQQESIASQIHFYKSRHHQQRAYIEKLRNEIAELKRQGREGSHLPVHQRHDVQQPSDSMNINGKRGMRELRRPLTTTSSPRSALTPLGQNRLTLPPGHHPPKLSSNRPYEGDGMPHYPVSSIQQRPERPGSSRFVQKFSYIPPPTGQALPQQFTHAQLASQRTKQDRAKRPHVSRAQQPQIVPSSASGRFKPSVSDHSIQPRGVSLQQPNTSRMSMAPPPTPQQDPQSQSLQPSSSRKHSTSNYQISAPDQRFAPPASRSFVPLVPPGAAKSHMRSDGVAADSSRAPSRAAQPNVNGGRQRMPFVPGTTGGFGHRMRET